MAFFRKKRNEVLDLTGRYRRQQEKKEGTEELLNNSSSQNEDVSGLGFFGAIANTASSSQDNSIQTYGSFDDAEEKKRRLSKRLMDMTEKIEELSNQIYHLQQRIELLERKAGVRGY